MSSVKIRKVYQRSVEARNNCCLPACISSLTGIPMREIPYQKRHIRKNWFTAMNKFLDSKGFELRIVLAELVKPDKPYIKCYEFKIDGGNIGSHSVVNVGFKTIHDPSKFLQKKIKPKGFNMSYKETYYLEISRKRTRPI